MKILGGRGQRRHEDVHADRPAEGEQAQEPERRNRASENEFHRAAVRLRSGVSGSRFREAQEPIPHGFEQAKRTRQILVRHLAEDEVANVLGYALDLIDRPAPARREHQALRAPVGAGPRIAR